MKNLQNGDEKNQYSSMNLPSFDPSNQKVYGWKFQCKMTKLDLAKIIL
jgi:hypothetical protein